MGGLIHGFVLHCIIVFWCVCIGQVRGVGWSIVPWFEEGLCIIIPVFESICFEMTQTTPNA